MENKDKQTGQTPEIILSKKERMQEIAATTLCFLLLLASLLKVLFL
jgi:hypothetical protein